MHAHHRAVKGVRLAPDFSRSRERPIVTGGRSGRLHLLKKGWLFGSMAEKVLHEGEGLIAALAWEGSLIAWANEAGVKVMDLEREEPVCFVAAPPDVPPPDVCPCRLVWESEATLLVAWGAHVRVITIKEKRIPAAGSGGGGAPHGGEEQLVVKRYGEVTTKFACRGALLAGIAPFGEDLALLWCAPPSSHARHPPRG